MKNLVKIFIVFVFVVYLFASNNYPVQFHKRTNIVEDTILSKQDSVYKYYKDKLNVYNYPINEKLPLLKTPDYNERQTTEKGKVNINVLLNKRMRYANIYLFINKEKVDLYYAVNGGEYTFRNVRLRTGKNYIELFYTIGNSRSNSTSFLINKK